MYSEKNTKERANKSTYCPSLSNTTSEGRSRLRMNRSSLKDGGWVSLQEITKRKEKKQHIGQIKLRYIWLEKVFHDTKISKKPLTLYYTVWVEIYTCQLFLRYKREIFILGVLGFLQTTRSFSKIP